MNFIHHILPLSYKNYKNTFLVGGAIRDYFIGRKPFDLDIVSGQNARKLAVKISKKIGGKIVPMGSSNNKIFRILSPLATIDVATLKGENIIEDLLNRDFTINALAYNLSNGEFFDPVEGAKDIRTRKIRVITKSVFQKDPVRLIRAYRFSLSLNFIITQSTQKEIIKNGALVTKVSGERMWIELSKIFNHPSSWLAIDHMQTSGFFFRIFPELIQFFNHNKNINDQIYKNYNFIHSYKYIESTLIGKKNINLYEACKSVIGIDKYHLLKYALLLSYIMLGPITITDLNIISKKCKYRNRERSQTVCDISKRLKLSSKQQKFTRSIAKTIIHPQLLFKAYLKGHLAKKEIFNYFQINGDVSVATMLGALAEVITNTMVMTPLQLKFINFIYSLLEQYTGAYSSIVKKEPLITGNDLIKFFNIPPSPKFKLILKRVHKARIYGEISNRKNALNMIKDLLE